MTGTYKKVLVAVDLLVTHDVYTIKRSLDLAEEWKAYVFMIHVIEPIHNYTTEREETLTNIEKNIEENARKAFADIVSEYDMTADQLIIDVGSPKQVIVDYAKKLDVDLIMVGTHSRHGMEAILGSTANGVINKAHCDVLTVRNPEK